MFFDFSTLPARDVYKLLANVVVPRPIALVTSCNENGLVNAAPYSFFNVVGSDPGLVVLGVGNRAPGVGKDTARNIRECGEFVVNLVPLELAEAMNLCAVDFPAEVSEIDIAGLEMVPSQLVKVPRLVRSPVNLECREHSTLQIGRNRLILGEVLGVWIGEGFVDAQNLRVDTDALNLIGRMGGGGGYLTLGERFEMPRMDYQTWLSSTDASSTNASDSPELPTS